MSSMTQEQAIDIAAEHLCIAASLSRDTKEIGFRSDNGVLLGIHVYPDYAVLKIKELLQQIIGETK